MATGVLTGISFLTSKTAHCTPLPPARDVVEEITYLREYTGPKPFAEDIRERMTSPANGSSLNAVAGISRFCKLSVHSLFPFRMISDTRIECRNADS